jgi:hypothetical protein
MNAIAGGVGSNLVGTNRRINYGDTKPIDTNHRL